MENKKVFVLIPLLGYVGLWILASPFFLIYFAIFQIPLDLEHITVMLQKIPALLAIITVPLCGFTSFFITTKLILRKYVVSTDTLMLLQIGIISLLFTIGVDLLTTVAIEKVNILVFPVNLMYLFVYLIIIPTISLAGYQKHPKSGL